MNPWINARAGGANPRWINLDTGARVALYTTLSAGLVVNHWSPTGEKTDITAAVKMRIFRGDANAGPEAVISEMLGGAV